MKIFLFFVYILIFSLININCGTHNCFEYSCEECDSPDYGNCTKCRSSFTLIAGTCPCSFSSCALCTTGLAGLKICEQCKEGYYNYQKDCYCEVDNCEQCAEDGCKKCITGYFYNETSKECLKESDEQKIQCFDPYCDTCFSEEQGACEFCKEGFYLKKGECFNLTLAKNGKCESRYYKDGIYCQEKCSGAKCNYRYYPGLYLCPDNDCLVCEDNILKIWSECDNSKECGSLNGCLNCIDSEECLVCQQGYYLLGGICKNCSEGCSICSSETKCEYCMSGYELTSNKTCILTYNFDYNIEVYKERKNNLIKIYHPEELVTIENTENIISNNMTSKIAGYTYNESEYKAQIQNDNLVNPTEALINKRTSLSCDKNCGKCKDNTGVCLECVKKYDLEENKCNLICSDKNCLSCELKVGKEICNECKTGYSINSNKCELICSINNCQECSLFGSLLICLKCKDGYVFNGSICKIKCKDNNCNVCSDDGVTCLECNSVTKLYNGKCALNQANCQSQYPHCNYCIPNEEGCIECDDGYKIDNKTCKKKKNNFLVYFLIIMAFTLIGLGSLFFYFYYRRKHLNNINNNNYDQHSDTNSNNPQFYNIRNNLDLSGSFRSALNQDLLAEEYETQKVKNKPKMVCMFCKKKIGNYKCDCGCIVCKEHSLLKEIERNEQKYKACFNCEKEVKNVIQIKYHCNICMQKKNSVAHFKCGCAIEVCKNCYIKCKTTNDKCPGCRKVI